MAIFTKYSPLALAVATLLSVPAFADDSETVHADLGTLKVTFDRQGAKVKTNVVTLQKKDESTATGLRELLKDEPAISFSGGNGASQYIYLRGMGQNSVDVKIDNAYSDSQILYHQGRHQLDPSLVKIVSVQKGAGSASAGIGQTNGAIVAKTVDALDLLKDNKNFGFKVGAGYSSNDETSYNASVYGKAGAFDFLVAGNQVKQGDYEAGKGYQSGVDGGKKVRYQDVDNINYLAKIGATFGEQRFVLSHMKENTKGTRNVREELDWFARQAPEYRELSLTQTNLEWKGRNLGFADEATANVYKLVNQRDSKGQEQYGNPGVQGLTLGQNTTKVDTIGANINFDSYVHDDVLLKYGLNYRHQEITPNYTRKATDMVGNPPAPYGINLYNQEKTDMGAYVEAIADIGKLTATAGLRYDHFTLKSMVGKEVSNGTLNPSIGLIYQATPTLSFNATHNHATRSPRMVDALLSHGGRGAISVADNVKAEKAQNTEVGFNYNDGKFSVNGSYYWQNIKDFLTRGQVCNHGCNGITTGILNQGEVENKGWEIGTSYRHKGLITRLGVAESDPKFPTGVNRDFAVKTGRTYTAGLSYNFTQPNVEIGVNYRRTDDVSTNIQGNPIPKIDGYHTTDVYANWKPYGNDKMNVNFSINNASDEFYRTQGGLPIATPAAGREFRVGFNYTY